MGISGWTYPGLARRLLPQGAPAARRAGVRRRTAHQHRDQRLVLLPPAPVVVPELARADSRRLRVRGQGRPVHHAPQEARRRRDRAGQLLRVRGAGAGREDRTVPVAAAADAGVRRGAAGGVLRPAAAHGRRGGRDRAGARRQGPRRPGADQHRRPRPAAAARAGGAARVLHPEGDGRPAREARHRDGGGRHRRQVAAAGRGDVGPRVRAAARGRRAVRQRLHRRRRWTGGPSAASRGPTTAGTSTSTSTTTRRASRRTTRWR